jgi:hypothetical protein
MGEKPCEAAREQSGGGAHHSGLAGSPSRRLVSLPTYEVAELSLLPVFLESRYKCHPSLF